MKKFYPSIVVGCLIISIGIVIAGFKIGGAIEHQSFGSPVPGSFEIYNSRGDYGDYMDEVQAAAYLCIQLETFEKYLQSGKLDGTFVNISAPKMDGNEVVAVGDLYIFSRAKLDEFMLGLISGD